MCKLEACPPGGTCSTRDIRQGRQKHLPCKRCPSVSAKGSKLRLAGLRLRGPVPSLPPPSALSTSFLLSLPLSVQYRQCIQPSRGLKGMSRETVHSGQAKGRLREGQ